MNRLHLSLLPIVLMLGSPRPARADELTDRVDKVFARWDTTRTPGCALGVVRDGKLIYQQAYGLADLEQGSIIGPDTVFHVASVSKQFTAFAVLLLEKDGRLSLDDDVRKHLPELHDFGKTITVRHLLQHTSGLRDQWSLLALAGWRMSDVITDDDIFRLVCRQRELNFEPGSRHLYSNTGYTLAAMIVERVSGQSFRTFTRKRIFEPLRMMHTRFPADHEEIVAGRARSYAPADAGKYKNAILSYGTAGATSLLTTVADLARWDQNFYEPQVGDAKLIERFQEVGRLNDGKAITYALGLEISEYQGLKVVEHGGSDAGFRCTLLRFPAERFSIIILANTADCGPSLLARRVAEIYLEGKLKPAPAKPGKSATPERKEVKVDPALFDAYAGEYRVMPGVNLAVAKEGGRLTARGPGAPKSVLAASSKREFFVPGADVAIRFDEPVEGRCPSLTLQFQGQTFVAKRVERSSLTAKQAEEFVGEYHSRELGVIYAITRRDDRLSIRHPRGERELHPVETDKFEAADPIGRVTFTRVEGGRIAGIQIDGSRVQRLRFDRVAIKPAE